MIERPQRIVVAVRKTTREKSQLPPDSDSIIVKDSHTVLAIEQKRSSIVPLRRTERKQLSTVTFDFDQAFDSNQTSEKIYQTLMSPLVDLICKGGKALWIAYAPAISGKTFLESGNAESPFIYKMVIHNMFRSMVDANLTKKIDKPRISLLAFEVWGDKQNFLLSEGSKPVEVASEKEALDLLELTSQLRTLSYEQRKTSSFFLQISVKGTFKEAGSLTLIDLSRDSQDRSKSNPSEANKALLFLQQRDMQKGRVYCSNKSRLAQNLKDAFQGCSKTVLIVNVNPSAKFTSVNIDTLRFAQKLKGVRSNVNNFRQARVNKQMVLPKHAVKLNETNGTENPPKPKKDHHKVSFNLPETQKSLQPCHKSIFLKNFRENNGITNKPTKKSDRMLHNKTFSELPMKGKVSQVPLLKSKPKASENFKTIKVLESDGSPSNSAVHYKTEDEEENLLGDPKEYLTERAQMFGITELSQSIYKTIVWADHPPDLMIPLTHSTQFNWDNVVKQFQQWKPERQKGEVYFNQAHQFLIAELVQEEDALGVLHSQTISKQVQTLKTQIELVNKLQKNRAECDPLDYIDTVEMSVDLKIDILQKLKEKIAGFRKHLGQQQKCEDKIRGFAGESRDVSSEFDHLEQSLLSC